MTTRCLVIAVAMFSVVAAAQLQAEQPSTKRGQVLSVSITAYCDSGVTRSGTTTREGIVAADPRVLPLGSIVRLQGLPPPYNRTYEVADTGRSVKGNDIDIFIADCDAAKQFGRQRGRAQVVRASDAPRH